MLDTVSLFDSMELDDTTHRVASRRALALAHHRIESSLGRFLRGARDEEEFFERLALVQDDFGGYVHTAAQEVGHDHPEHTAAAIVRHYAVAFEKTPAEEELEDQEDAQPEGKEASTRRWIPHTAGPNSQGQLFPSGQQQMGQDAQGQMGPGMMSCPDCGSPVIPGQGACPACGSNRALLNTMSEGAQAGVPGMETHPDYQRAGKQSAPLGPNPYDQPGENFYDAQGQQGLDPLRNPGGYVRPSIVPPAGNPKSPTNGEIDEGFESIPYNVDPNLPPGALDPRNYREDAGLNIGPNLPGVQVPRHYPNRYQGAEQQNNTGLGGPEPKMDKSQGPGSKPEVPGKIKHMDILEPIIRKNDDKLEEIGDTKHESLPSNSSDEPFSTGGEEHGPHTDTWSDKGQADPVTRESLSSANPLVALLDDPWPSDDLVKRAFERS